ncbi:hypothetical protein SSS_10695 [Sarcoptes scabiei]|nr:hypothetical protein SSS_10695 [Sarcoptes scabiei]
MEIIFFTDSIRLVVFFILHFSTFIAYSLLSSSPHLYDIMMMLLSNQKGYSILLFLVASRNHHTFNLFSLVRLSEMIVIDFSLSLSLSLSLDCFNQNHLHC